MSLQPESVLLQKLAMLRQIGRYPLRDASWTDVFIDKKFRDRTHGRGSHATARRQCTRVD